MPIKHYSKMYSELTYSLDLKEVGSRSKGLGHGFLDNNFYNKNPWYKDVFLNYVSGSTDWWHVWSQMPEFGAKLYEVNLNKKAQNSDFIDFAGLMRGFFVNDRLRNILEKAHLPKHNFFATTFIQEGNIIEGYWWFVYDMETGMNTVNFEQCEYGRKYHQTQPQGNFTVDIKTYQDYLSAFYSTGQALKVNKLSLNTNFDRGLDIWGTQFLTMRKAYISDRLVDLFKREKISGFRVIPLSSSLAFDF